METMKGDMCKSCKCPHHKVIPGLIALFGLTFLLGATGTLSASAVNIIWPVIIIVAGVSKMTSCKCC